MRMQRQFGNHGVKNRKTQKATAPRPPRAAGEILAMPKSMAEPWTPYVMKVTGPVGIADCEPVAEPLSARIPFCELWKFDRPVDHRAPALRNPPSGLLRLTSGGENHPIGGRKVAGTAGGEPRAFGPPPLREAPGIEAAVGHRPEAQPAASSRTGGPDRMSAERRMHHQ